MILYTCMSVCLYVNGCVLYSCGCFAVKRIGNICMLLCCFYFFISLFVYLPIYYYFFIYSYVEWSGVADYNVDAQLYIPICASNETTTNYWGLKKNIDTCGASPIAIAMVL